MLGPAWQVGPGSFLDGKVMVSPALRLSINRYSPGLSQMTPGPLALSISDEDAREFIDIIYKESGIVLSPNKKTMISSRLYRRVTGLGLESFREYLDYLQMSVDRDIEIMAMVDEITTNKTAFFRESHHFDYLVSNVLPTFGNRSINIWSAGCSTGEEPYTLAMVLAEYYGTPSKFTILAVDLSTRALQAARQGIYALELGKPIPLELRRKYTLSGCGPQAGRFRIVPELRERIRFGRFNLFESRWDIPSEFDIVFCRNVMIYFDRKTRGAVVRRFGENLRPGGYFFIGHSETLNDLDSSFAQTYPTVYSMGAS